MIVALSLQETRTLAEIAKAELDGKVIGDRAIRIRVPVHSAALTVRNLLPVVTNELLERVSRPELPRTTAASNHHLSCDSYCGIFCQAFSQFGAVERAIVVTDDQDCPTGKGIVEFANKAAARKALECCTEGALLLTT